MYDHRTTNPFYSVSREAKFTALAELPGMAIVDVLDDISDGCGGCEARRITGADGVRYWVSVFSDMGQRVDYIAFTIDPNEPTIVGQFAVVGLAWNGTTSQDSRETYAAAVEAVEAFADAESDR